MAKKVKLTYKEGFQKGLAMGEVKCLQAFEEGRAEQRRQTVTFNDLVQGLVELQEKTNALMDTAASLGFDLYAIRGAVERLVDVDEAFYQALNNM